jgi:hypothetical protein
VIEETTITSNACDNFQPQVFKKLFCLNCFLHQNEHNNNNNKSNSNNTPTKNNVTSTPQIKQSINSDNNIHISLPSPQKQQNNNKQKITKSITISESTQEVINYLNTLELTKDYSKEIIKEGIDFDALSLLSEEDLKSIGFTALGDRKKVFAACKVLLEEKNVMTKEQQQMKGINSRAGISTPQRVLTLERGKAVLSRVSSQQKNIDRDLTFRLHEETTGSKDNENIEISSNIIFDPDRLSEIEKVVDFDDF